MKHRITDALIWVVGTELVGAASAIVAGGGFSAYYASLVRPPLAPPGWLFPVAWAILYALMGLSAHLVHRSGSDGTRAALGLYAAQLLANFLWSPVFFGLKSLAGATVVALVLLVLVIAMVVVFGRIVRRAALLNVPYLLWTMYAAYLTVGVLVLNG